MNDIDSFNQIWTTNHYTILHELGHALTLKHTSPDQSPDQPPYLLASEQNNNFTVMLYVLEADGTNQTYAADGEWDYRHFQLYDVYALQLRFGVNTQTYAGASVHTSESLHMDEWLRVLWDASGTDTIDMSQQLRDQRISLGQGTFSDIGSRTGNNPTGDNLAIAFGAQIENATGGSGNDGIAGNELNNVLHGRAGNDHIIGGAGSDNLYGEAGDDLIGGQDGDDFIDGGAGIDSLYGDAGNDHIIGGTENDKLYGQDGADLIGGQDGDDFIDGGAGIDSLYGDAGNDHIIGGTENDKLYGQDGADLIGGQDGDDAILGGNGRDILYGDAGNDAITGGADADDLNGQAGADRFVFTATSDSRAGAMDRILDFDQVAGDLIDLSSIDANANTAGNDVFTFVGTNAFSNRAGELRYEIIDNQVHVFADVNGDAVADMAFVVNTSSVQNQDFIL